MPVRVDGKVVAPAVEKSAKSEETQVKQLEIKLSTLSSKNLGPLSVKCTFFAKDLKANTNVVEKEVSLEATLVQGEAVVKTPPEDFKSNQAHFEKGKATTNNATKTKTTTKKVEASGHEYSGWGVKVYDKSNQLVGKAYSASFLDPDNAAHH